MGHIRQGCDNCNSQVNDVQNLGQMRLHCNLPPLSGQLFFFLGGGTFPNHVFQKVLVYLRILFEERSNGQNATLAASGEVCFYVLQAHARKQTLTLNKNLL